MGEYSGKFTELSLKRKQWLLVFNSLTDISETRIRQLYKHATVG